VTLPFRARDALVWSNGSLVQGDAEAEFCGVSIDTRSILPGQLFVAIVGPRHDAHDHIAQALAAKAAGVVVVRARPLPKDIPPQLPVIAVDDTTRALGALGVGHRAGHTGPLVAITGSNGKTSTKEMCAAILSVAAPCLKNEGNLNNQFGLPLTLLRRDAADRSVVVEIGMNHRGEIAALAAIARPTIGVITNVGTAHIEHLGSREEIALEKGDLVAGLDPSGVAVLNADDPFVREQSARTQARCVFFGRDAAAEVRAEGVRHHEGRGIRFDLLTPEGRIAIEMAGLGDTAVQNALAASAAALAAGATLDDIRVGLARYESVGGRLEPIALREGSVLINDTYNANPQSMAVALNILAESQSRDAAPDQNGVTRIAVLGDMGELGETGSDAHRETGKLAARLGIDHLFALGEHAEEVAEGARSEGMDPRNIHTGSDWHAMGEQVRAQLGARNRVLVKGSRAMRMERIVHHLVARDGQQPEGHGRADAGSGL